MSTLAAHPIDRIRTRLREAWPRFLPPRRVLACCLAVLALALALRPTGRAGPPTAPMVVAAHDLGAGATLTSGDVRVISAPAALVPPATLSSADQVVGRVLAGVAGAGEPITSVRLLGAENTRLTAGSDELVSVAVRLSDPAVADLLHPGSRVDVVTVNPRGGPGARLAEGATVVTVRDGESSGGHSDDKGRLVVIALPGDSATQVASASLGQPVTVTLR